MPHSLQDYVTACGRRNNSQTGVLLLRDRSGTAFVTVQHCTCSEATSGARCTWQCDTTGQCWLAGKAAASRRWTQQDVDRLEAPMNLTMNVALHAVKELQEQVQAPHNPTDALYVMPHAVIGATWPASWV